MPPPRSDVELLHDITTRHALLAIGFCLLFTGIILRNFARNMQRSRDYRRQHSLHHRPLAEAQADTANQATSLERNFPRIANGVVLLGMLAVIASFFRD